MTENSNFFPETITTFDTIVPKIQEWLNFHSDSLNSFVNKKDRWLLVNRNLNGRVRLILPQHMNTREDLVLWNPLVSNLMQRLGKHAPVQSKKILLETELPSTEILFESNKEQALKGAASYLIKGFTNVWIVDRLATEANWARITPKTQGAPRVVFFSIKGGVGRSTALAASAWSLAQQGKRVLVLDLDLESPGLSSALLPADRQPKYGITDWLVEDLVDNGDVILDSIFSTSNLSHDGEILVVPAHGGEHGEYISKLGRVWMPKLHPDGIREAWSSRLNRLLRMLEEKFQPDVVLIDSRSGIDEIASACITELGASLILLFALEGEQTWNGYRMLFEQWQRAGVTDQIRDRLQIVGAIAPELNRAEYLEGLRENSYKVFISTLYDELAPTEAGDVNGVWRVKELSDGWSFDESDETAPHHPWAVNWNRGFAGLRSLHGRLAEIDSKEVEQVFGALISGINNIVDEGKSHDTDS